MLLQSNWRNCQKCQALFFSGFPKKGVCKAGGEHFSAKDSFNFFLPHEEPGTDHAQSEWRNCKKCQVLFFNGFPKKGVCAAGGEHDAALGFNFVLPHDVRPQDVHVTNHAQPEWRNCRKCQAIFFNGFKTKGVCPAGSQHDPALGFNFVLPRQGSGFDGDTDSNRADQ